MTFRSRANPDQRRRRVLLDETLSEESRPTVAPPPSGKRNKRYPDDALTDAQPRITDFVPSTWRMVVGISLALGFLDAGIAALHWFAPVWQEKFPEIPLGVLDATSATGLAQPLIFGKLLLVLAGTALIFAIRRRRLDDLRGTYQVWIWATIVAAGVVLIASTDLSELLAFALARIPRVPELGQSRYYVWLMLLALAFPLAIRLLIEVRRVRPAQVLLILSFFPFAIRESLVMQWIPLNERIASTLFAFSTLLSCTLLLGAVLSYARYVKLDALGAFNKKKGKKRKKKDPVATEEASNDDTDSAARRRIDTGSPGVARPNSLGTSRDSDEDRSSGPLSKANRKAQKR